MKSKFTIKDAINAIKNALKNDYESTEIDGLLRIIMEHLTGLNAAELHINLDQVLAEQQVDELETILPGLQKMQPIQYILGETEFYGLTLQVNEQVLIPRQETEELVDWIINTEQLANPVILDIGTGSGCIALSLKHEIPAANIFAIDVSDRAIKTAQENATNNKLDVQFIKADILKTTDLNFMPKADIIVSNPPYVMNSEKELMQANVLDYEPELALFVENNEPLIFYRKITELASLNLKPGGKLFFEINEQLGNEMQALLTEFHFNNIELRKDLFGKDRMIMGQKVES